MDAVIKITGVQNFMQPMQKRSNLSPTAFTAAPRTDIRYFTMKAR